MTTQKRQYAGRRFGKIIVQKDEFTGASKKTLCRCDCGTEKLISLYALLSGRVKTCGSCNRSMDRFVSVIGQTFGKLTVIEEPEVCRNRRVICKCECGTVVKKILSNLKRGQVKSCGCTKWYKPERGYVYYLFDPIDMRLRYIGQSTQKPSVRIANHLYSCKEKGRRRSCEEKRAWINGLKPYRPAIWIAEKDIPVSILDQREQWHIAEAIKRGDSLLNIHHARGLL